MDVSSMPVDLPRPGRRLGFPGAPSAGWRLCRLPRLSVSRNRSLRRRVQPSACRWLPGSGAAVFRQGNPVWFLERRRAIPRSVGRSVYNPVWFSCRLCRSPLPPTGADGGLSVSGFRPGLVPHVFSCLGLFRASRKGQSRWLSAVPLAPSADGGAAGCGAFPHSILSGIVQAPAEDAVCVGAYSCTTACRGWFPQKKTIKKGWVCFRTAVQSPAPRASFSGCQPGRRAGVR